VPLRFFFLWAAIPPSPPRRIRFHPPLENGLALGALPGTSFSCFLGLRASSLFASCRAALSTTNTLQSLRGPLPIWSSAEYSSFFARGYDRDFWGGGVFSFPCSFRRFPTFYDFSWALEFGLFCCVLYSGCAMVVVIPHVPFNTVEFFPVSWNDLELVMVRLSD